MKHILFAFCFLFATQSAHATSSCIRDVSEDAVMSVQVIVTDTKSFKNPGNDVWMTLQAGYGWIGPSPFFYTVDISFSAIGQHGNLYVSTGVGHFTVKELCDAKEKIEDYIKTHKLTGHESESHIRLFSSFGSGTAGLGTTLDHLIQKIEDAKKDHSGSKFTYTTDDFALYNAKAYLTLIEM